MSMDPLSDGVGSQEVTRKSFVKQMSEAQVVLLTAFWLLCFHLTPVTMILSPTKDHVMLSQSENKWQSRCISSIESYFRPE